MTGFARATSGDLTLTLKAVNHRGLDLHFHVPPQFDGYEARIRELLKGNICRGSVQIRVEQASSYALTLNRPLLRTWLETFESVARELKLDSKPDLNQAFRMPGIFQQEASPETTLEGDILKLAEEALTEFNAFRDREGAAIDAELLQRTRAVAQIAAKIAQIRTTAVHVFQQRLTTRLAELLSNTIEPQRLAHEAAILADRSDVSEELVRLQTHAAQVEALLAAPGEKGKKLDFLLQEMNRETNTILSKTSGLGDIGLTVTDLALAAKSEIDKIREQSLNLE
ncbi:MAG: hypothetical protein JWO80_2755 [Bryobacterales bacterium]|nr:hypothetical protein [Bryobacterales bacterium]